MRSLIIATSPIHNKNSIYVSEKNVNKLRSPVEKRRLTKKKIDDNIQCICAELNASYEDLE